MLSRKKSTCLDTFWAHRCIDINMKKYHAKEPGLCSPHFEITCCRWSRMVGRCNTGAINNSYSLLLFVPCLNCLSLSLFFCLKFFIVVLICKGRGQQHRGQGSPWPFWNSFNVLNLISCYIKLQVVNKIFLKLKLF